MDVLKLVLAPEGVFLMAHPIRHSVGTSSKQCLTDIHAVSSEVFTKFPGRFKIDTICTAA